MLELEKISKVVGGRTHIKETSLTLQSGQFNVLLGETGAGKTSLIKLMAGLDPLASGTIRMDGQDVTKLTTQQRQISLVHQFFINYPHMTVFENIASPLRVAGLAKSEIAGRVEEAADILKLKPLLNRRPHELSADSSSEPRLPEPSPRSPRRFFWTNRSPIWTTNCAKSYASSYRISFRAAARLLFTPPQSRRRPYCSAVRQR